MSVKKTNVRQLVTLSLLSAVLLIMSFKYHAPEKLFVNQVADLAEEEPEEDEVEEEIEEEAAEETEETTEE